MWNKLQEYLDIPSEKIWAHLETMYNMESLDDIESLPFPNDEQDFYLPESEYGSLKLKKEEKVEEKTPKPAIVKKSDSKDTPKVNKEIKKEEKTPKKDTQRRDSKDGKDVKTPIINKKEVKKEIEKAKPLKGKTNAKEDDKMKTPKMEEKRVLNKRPTRGSMKPDDITNRKSQSPLTVTPQSATKRRRI